MAEFNIDKLNIQISANATKASNSLDKLAAKVDKLQAILNKAAPVSERFNKSISKLSKTTKAIDVKPINSLSSSIKTMTNQSSSIDKVTNSLKKLNTASAKTTTMTSQSSGRGGTGLMGLFGMVGKIGLLYYGLKRVGQGFAYAITQANEYVETMNLFTVAMGDSYDETLKFVQTFSKATGVDPSNLARNTALFYQISTSMGLANEKAQVLSENFTKLGYDLASLYNIEVEEAFTKLKAGLVGETEPLRRLGIVITENNLAETARRLGITKSIRTMTEMEKMQLRYITALDQTKNAQGDFARTIEQPSNMLRVLSGQFSQLVRALGNLFIPMLQRTLPYVIALTQVLTNLFNRLAALVGFEMPEFQGSQYGATDYLEDVEDAANAAGAAVKGVLAPFDKLNVLNAQSSSSSGISAGGGDLLDLDLEGYDNLLDQIDTKWNGIAQDIKSSFGTIGEAFSGIDLGPLVTSFNTLKVALQPFIGTLSKGLKLFVDNILGPFTEWTIEEALPVVINLLAAAFKILNEKLIAFGIAFGPLWDEYFGPGVVILGRSLIQGLTLLLRLLGKLENNESLSGFANTELYIFGIKADTVGRIFLGMAKTVEGAIGLIDNLVTGDLSGIAESFATLTEGIVDVFLNYIESLMNGAIDKVNNLLKAVNVLLGVLGREELPLLGHVDLQSIIDSNWGGTRESSSGNTHGGYGSGFEVRKPNMGGGAGSFGNDNSLVESLVDSFNGAIEFFKNTQSQETVLQVDGETLGKVVKKNQQTTDRVNGGYSSNKPILSSQ